jgi:D-alanine transfer protein
LQNFPNNPDAASSVRRHLRAVLVAVGVLFLLGALGLEAAFSLEKRRIHAAAPEISTDKDLGVAWQRAVFAEPDILPLYGSSELTKHFGNEPQRFFASYPTGFSVSPVGRGGCTSIILAERVAATGAETTPNRKLAISISPSWFFHAEAHHRWYVGNFSAAQASALIFSPRLSLELKRDFAHRMLDYPDSVEHAPLLSFALFRLVGKRPLDLALFRAVTPLARLQNALVAINDHFTFAWHLLRDHELAHAPKREHRALEWVDILAAESGEPPARRDDKGDDVWANFSTNQSFVQVLNHSREWSDLELFLRVTRELHLDPLLISIPIDDDYYVKAGVTRESLDQYLPHLRALAQRYDVALVDFAEHQGEAAFFADHHDHLSARGWLYFNRALDFYYHGADPRSSFPTAKESQTDIQ